MERAQEPVDGTKGDEMAKIRIYELARDLDMKNKALLEKLSDLGISASSHMSSIDEEAVAQVKAAVVGKRVYVVEETRVKPTVIRRRKKTVKREAAAIEEGAEVEAEVESNESAEAAAPSETEPAEATADEATAPEAEEKEEKPATVLKVVRKAALEEEEAPAAEAQAPPEEEIAEPPAPEQETEAASTAAETIQPVEEELPADVESKEASAGDEAQKAAEPAEPVEKEEKPAPAPAKPKKRGKKETPAKIIKMPTAPVAPEQPSTEGGRGEPAAVQEDDTAAKRGKKSRKKQEELEKEKKFFKKKISFRRKAVVEGEDLYSRGPRGRKGKKMAKGKASPSMQKTTITTAKAIKRRVKVDDTIVLSDLAKRMGIKAGDMIKKLMGMGVMATVNQTIDFDTAALVAAEFGYEVERASFEEEAILKVESNDAPETLKERPPVVTIMGHVDHGKTSLLDVIRKSSLTEGEAGGITQHIGAYSVNTDKGRIAFLDTPGHEAFTAMRSRGASVTDLVVLVVAADDGVMPQTLEAINHSRAAEVPIIVAINKIDKNNAEPDKVKRQLAEAGLTPEDWGGDTIFVPVSAKQKTGIEELMEMILLQSEVLELKANPDKLASGRVIEAKLDSGRGPVATVLVQEGTLRVQDAVVCGIHYGKIRAMSDDKGQAVDEAGPSVPVEIIGLSGVPAAGDEMVALNDERDAKQVSEHRVQKQRSKELAKTTRVSLENLFEQMQEGDVKELNLIIKADVHGSIEALKDSLVKLSNEEVKIHVVHSATGTITEHDVTLASVSNAIIIGFNVRPNAKVQALAAEEHVDVRFYNIIYNVIKDVQDAIVGMMSSTYEEHTLGMAEVRQVFHVPKVGSIAGCYVTDGKMQRGSQVRVLRDGVVQYEGKIISLKRYKDDAKEVASGYECGVGIENFNDVKVGDLLECFYLEEIKPTVA